VAKSATPVTDPLNEQHKEIKVKKVLVTLAAIGMLCALPGCNNRSDEPTLKTGQETALQPMQQSWRGVLPCADCEGIETSLFLAKDGTWVMNERYQGVEREPSSFASYGTWARTAEKLVLTDNKGEKSYYRAKGDKLEMLDREGNPITSSLNYTLEPVKSSLPVTPMAMRGMYFYMADAAIFTDCATGKRVPVANNAQLERDYAAARGNESKPVLLIVEAHFTLQANPDTGEQVKTLVADKSMKFDAKKTCHD
jgi:copper homeostasis protein (lipoprotein)